MLKFIDVLLVAHLNALNLNVIWIVVCLYSPKYAMLDILSSEVLLVLGDLSDGATPPDARQLYISFSTLKSSSQWEPLQGILNKHLLAIYMHNKAPSQSIIWTQPPEEEDKNISWLRLLSQKSVTSGKNLSEPETSQNKASRFPLDWVLGLNTHSLLKNQQI